MYIVYRIKLKMNNINVGIFLRFWWAYISRENVSGEKWVNDADNYNQYFV